MSNHRIDKKITILISCVGRQVALVKQFKSILPAESRVITCDVDKFAAGSAVADVSFIAPPFDDPNYIFWLLNLCKHEAVSMLLTLFDEELLLLEKHRSEFEDLGVCLMGMPLSNLQICLDKRRLNELCYNTGLKYPKQWLFTDLDDIPKAAYPLVAKEISGKGSRGQRILNDSESALLLMQELKKENCIDNYILQEKLTGDEYGLDLVNDLNGNPVTTFVRRKYRMRDGETEIAESSDDKKLTMFGHSLAKRLEHKGLVDCDIIRCNDGDYLLDVNARFGGGYIFSHFAGANVPAVFVSWLQGKRPNPSWLIPKPGLIFARVSTLQRLDNKKQNVVIITSGSYSIGMGHLSRQIALAKEAERSGFNVLMIVDDEKALKYLNSAGLNSMVINDKNQEELEYELTAINPVSLIIDVHEKDFSRFSWVADKFLTLLIVSRVGFDFSYYGDNVILVGEDQDYWCTQRIINREEKATKIYSGRAYIIFRDEFKNISNLSAAKHENTILIAHGGADPHKLTQRCLKALDLTQYLYEVKVLVGPMFTGIEDINKLAAISKHNCEVIIGANNIAQIMSKVGLALINGGNVRYELCLTGTPFVAISFREKQYDCTNEIVCQGVGYNMGVMFDITDLDIAKAVDEVMSNKENLDKMSSKMRNMYDTEGAKRVLTIALGKGDNICNV